MKTEAPKDYTLEEIIDMMTTWACRGEFTAATCGGRSAPGGGGVCGSTANVLHGPGWVCGCGHYNTLPYSGRQIPHEDPTYGPPAERIHAAVKARA